MLFVLNDLSWALTMFKVPILGSCAKCMNSVWGKTSAAIGYWKRTTLRWDTSVAHIRKNFLFGEFCDGFIANRLPYFMGHRVYWQCRVRIILVNSSGVQVSDVTTAVPDIHAPVLQWYWYRSLPLDQQAHDCRVSRVILPTDTNRPIVQYKWSKDWKKISTKLKIGTNAPKSILNDILKVPMPPPCAFQIMTSWPDDVIMGKFLPENLL